jgi:hypothetical protein
MDDIANKTLKEWKSLKFVTKHVQVKTNETPKQN